MFDLGVRLKFLQALREFYLMFDFDQIHSQCLEVQRGEVFFMLFLFCFCYSSGDVRFASNPSQVLREKFCFERNIEHSSVCGMSEDIFSFFYKVDFLGASFDLNIGQWPMFSFCQFLLPGILAYMSYSQETAFMCQLTDYRHRAHLFDLDCLYLPSIDTGHISLT